MSLHRQASSRTAMSTRLKTSSRNTLLVRRMAERTLAKWCAPPTITKLSRRWPTGSSGQPQAGMAGSGWSARWNQARCVKPLFRRCFPSSHWPGQFWRRRRAQRTPLGVRCMGSGPEGGGRRACIVDKLGGVATGGIGDSSFGSGASAPVQRPARVLPGREQRRGGGQQTLREQDMRVLLEQQRLRLTNGSVTCFNVWVDAPPEASAGTGTLRGGDVKAASKAPGDGWMLSDEVRSSDVEIYLDRAAQDSALRGLHSTTLGRILFFFEHKGNGGPGSMFNGPRYESMSRRAEEKLVSLTPFTLRKTVRFFPVSSIRSSVHMIHRCVFTGASPCRLVGEAREKKTWQCQKQSTASRYLLNKCFHSFGREPIAWGES